MTALDDSLALFESRYEVIVTTYDLATRPDVGLALVDEALAALSVDGTAAALTTAETASMRLALDVVVWRWVETRAALGFDFSADGGSYQRSQLAKQATEMRRRAEDRAAAAGLSAYAWPAVEYDKPVNNLLSDEWGEDAGIYQW